jgi:ferredoxin-thioredoxin reductase catalytic subunit
MYGKQVTMESSTLVRDQLAGMLRQEAKYMVNHVPCRSLSHETRPELEEWRRKICQWSYRVIDHFRL